MRFPTLHCSRLGWRPHMVRLKEHCLGDRTQEFWIVEVDDRPLTDHAMPFSASSKLIELQGCTGCGYPEDGTDFLSVRRYGERVLWMPSVEEYRQALRSERFWFEGAAYRQAIGSGDFAEIPEISAPDFRNLVQPEIAAFVEAVAIVGVEPYPKPLPRFLQGLHEAILAPGLEVVAEFDSTHEIRLVLDRHKCPEARLWVRREGETVKAVLAEHPCFPVGFSSPALSALLSRVGWIEAVKG